MAVPLAHFCLESCLPDLFQRIEQEGYFQCLRQLQAEEGALVELTLSELTWTQRHRNYSVTLCNRKGQEQLAQRPRQALYYANFKRWTDSLSAPS